MNAMMRAGLLLVLMNAGSLTLAVAVQAQSPTKAQQDAIRSNCRSDFMRNCSSVTPGGREALMCLEQHRASLSAGCRSAVDAIATAAAPKPTAAPAAPAPPAATNPEPAAPPAQAAPAAAPAHAAPHAPAHAPAQPPAAAKPAAPPPAAARPAPAPKAVAVPAPPAPPAPPQAAAPPVAAPDPAPAAEPHQPTLIEAAIVRRFCVTDFRVLCQGVPLGGGRAIQCLANNRQALSPGCRQAMADTGALRP